MTTEEKARAYDEALEDMRVIYPNLRGDAKLAVEHAFPALAESEDESTRKALIETVKCIYAGDTMFLSEQQRDRYLDWLEKQKENPESADSIPSNCTSYAKCEDRDSNYGIYPEDVIVVARACEKLEAHGYPELAHALKNVNLYTKEQKPVDYDHEMWKNCEANFEGGKKEVIEHPEKYGLQKPAEWSDEDEKYLNRVINLWVNDFGEDSDTVKWLKSLRPSWRPSEEQMKAFKKYIEEFQARAEAAVGGWNNFDVMIRLYEQLKKL